MSTLFVVTGETSGDRHAALVVVELLRERPHLKCRGVGSVHLRQAGVELLCDSSRWSAMGFAQALPRVPLFMRAFATVKNALAAEPPDLLLLVDFGAFNMRLAFWARSLGIPILYYCPPRSWARRNPRIGSVARAADAIATPFSWSAEQLNAAGGRAVFVGHPVLETARGSAPRESLRREFGVGKEDKLVGILPGSRAFEVSSLLSRLLRAAAWLRDAGARRPKRMGIRFVLSLSPNLPESLIAARRRWTEKLDIPVVRGRTSDILAASDFAWVASGTATLEAAVLGVPMVILYDARYLSRAEAFLLRRRLRFIGLPNLIANRSIVPEITGPDFTPQRLVAETTHRLFCGTTYNRIKDDLAGVRGQLGEAGASRRTARLALDMLDHVRTSAARSPIEQRASHVGLA